MKIQYLYILLICLLIFSCKKEKNIVATDNIGTNTFYKLSFNVSSFSENITTLGQAGGLSTNALKTNTTPSLKDTVDVLYYLIFDSYGQTLHQVQQLSSATNFGTIKDSLTTPGTYTVVMAAGKTGMHITDGSSSLWVGTLNDIGFSYVDDTVKRTVNLTPWNDAFYKKFTVTVPTSNTIQHVSLDRFVSQLQVNITDNVPVGAASIELIISNDSKTGPFASNQTYDIRSFPYSTQTIKAIPSAQIGQPNFQITTYSINYYVPFSVTLNCYDTSNKLMASKSVSNVTCQKNKKTVLTGKLFDAIISGGGFHVGTGSVWNNPVTVPF